MNDFQALDSGWSQDIFSKFSQPEEMAAVSLEIDRSMLQESHSFRILSLAKQIAREILTERGDLDDQKIDEWIGILKKNLYSFSIQRQWDNVYKKHIIKALKSVKASREIQMELKRISKPLSNQHAQKIIRLSCGLNSKEIVTDFHAKAAALSAYFFPLRQSVGSCFATAPAIMVQGEQPEQFFKDIQELLATGRLKRTFEGIEYAVPLSPSLGSGELRKPFFLSSLEDAPLYRSPGLNYALKECGLLQNETLKELLERILKKEKGNLHVLSAEKCIKEALLEHHALSEEKIQALASEPKEGRGMFFSVSSTSSATLRKWHQFESDFEHAKEMFKSWSDHPLLKAWEYTLASFAETKSQFAKWNFYASLGLNPQEKGGIGERLFYFLQRKLDECNAQARQYQEEYELVYHQIQSYQARIRAASSEQESRWIRAEYQSKANEFYTLEQLRNRTHAKANSYAHLFDRLIDLYTALFPRYFQEVYDADMQEVKLSPYDDSPAGFRLLYKHGRSNTSQWSLIHNPKEFTEALVNFFVATESELAGSPLFQGMENDVAEIVTVIVSHIRSDEFIKTSFDRMAVAHNTLPIKDPLNHLDQIEKKPWAYTSGGVIDTFLSCYFKRSEKPKEVERWVESPSELLVFLVDNLKFLSDQELDFFIQNPDRSMLIHSPTHAFLLKPGWKGMKELWESRNYTYTEVRDGFVNPAEAIVSQILLNDEGIDFFIQILLEHVPMNFRPYFKEMGKTLHGPMLVSDFRDFIADMLNTSPGLRSGDQPVVSLELVDSILFSNLPLCPVHKLQERIEEFLHEFPKEEVKKAIQDHFPDRFKRAFVGAVEMLDIAMGFLILLTKKTSSKVNYLEKFVQMGRQRGWLLPKPLLFADTNWSKNYFAFLVSPASGKLALWRVDPLGITGFPMLSWKAWLDGTKQTPKWGCFTKILDYQS